ncbi:hypothetical protein [Paenibacillus sp. PL2-23]|uniref:hypothetical protein n=1 Tax=Paenibacillus sp. PL2-23 TaxID=2100729 RepID=UPI0030F69A28
MLQEYERDGSLAVKRQARILKQYAEDFLKEALVGVYEVEDALDVEQGSLAMRMVVNRALTVQERFQLMVACLGFHRKPLPIDISIVLQADPAESRHSSQFHFSDCWRKQFADMAYWDDTSFWEHEQPSLTLALPVRSPRETGLSAQSARSHYS